MASREHPAAYTEIAVVSRDEDRRWVVLYRGETCARFRPLEEGNAIDFANGFNAGLREATRHAAA